MIRNRTLKKNAIPTVLTFDPKRFKASNGYVFISNYIFKDKTEDKMSMLPPAMRQTIIENLVKSSYAEYILEEIQNDALRRKEDSGLSVKDFHAVIKDFADRHNQSVLFSHEEDLFITGNKATIEKLKEECGDKFGYILLNARKMNFLYSQMLQDCFDKQKVSDYVQKIPQFD